MSRAHIFFCLLGDALVNVMELRDKAIGTA